MSITTQIRATCDLCGKIHSGEKLITEEKLRNSIEIKRWKTFYLENGETLEVCDECMKRISKKMMDFLSENAIDDETV